MSSVPKVVIFHAMDSERDGIITPVLKELGCGEDVWVLKTGVGKVKATAFAAMLLSHLPKDVVCINVGVCGGSKEAFEACPCAVIDCVVDGDFDTSVFDGVPFNKPKWFLSEGSSKVCFTQDHVTTSIDECVDSVGGVRGSELVYADMELFGIAEVCALLGFKLVGIKSISDVIGDSGQSKQYEGGVDLACSRAVPILKSILSGILDV